MAVNLSGSLVITGSITTTGTISMSGSIASASYATNADLLDGLDSTVFTLTSSFNAQTASFTAFTSSINSFSASILAQTASLNLFSSSVLTFTGSALTRLGALEAATSSLYSYTSSLNNKTSSFATTGSNTFIGTQTITGSVLQSGSFTTTGTIIAQTINVQQVTSSIVYSCGSNIFGTSISNTQQLTGSVGITGSLTIAGASSATSYNGATIFGSTIACSPIGCFATSCATSFIGGNMSGTTIYGSTAVCSPVGKFTSCVDAGSGTFSGNVVIGGSSPVYLKFNVQETAANRVAILYRGTQGGDASMITAFGTPYLSIGGQENLVNSIQTIGFGFTNGTTYTKPAEIGFQTTSTSGYTCGDLVFATRGATTNTVPTERMRITSAGNVGIGTTSPSYKLDICTAQSIRVIGSSTGYTQGSIIFQSSTTDTPEARGLGVYAFNEGTDATWFYGTAYNSADSFVINRKSGTTYQDSAAAVGEACNFLLVNNSGVVGIGTTNLNAEANLFLGAKGTTEGGQMVFQKATSFQCATHIDNYSNCFRIMSGTDTGSTTVNMSINHVNGNAIFGSSVTANTITGTNGVNTVSTVSSIPFTTWTTLATIDSNTTGMYLVVIGLTGGGGALTDWTATGIVYTNGSTAAWLTGPTNGSLIQLRISGLAIQVYQNGTNPSISLSYKLLKIS